MADAHVTPLSIDPHVSTGSLPTTDRIVDAMQRALAAVRNDRRGATSSVYPALESADPDVVGIALAGVSGRVESVGDDHIVFTIMSVVKPFVLGLVGDAVGAERVRSIVGVNATGLAFNSAEPVERMPGGRTNPMVNAGAIATTALTPGASLDDRWGFLLDVRDVATMGATIANGGRNPRTGEQVVARRCVTT